LLDLQHPTNTFLRILFGATAVYVREKMICWKVWPRNNIIFGLKMYILVLEKMYLKDFNES
jgi:hypothetical protein